MPDAPFSTEPGTLDVSRFFISPLASPSAPSSVTQIESVVTGSGYGSVPLLVESAEGSLEVLGPRHPATLQSMGILEAVERVKKMEEIRLWGDHPGITCDATNGPIFGARYHLAGADYDLCEAAWKALPSPSLGT